MVEAGRARVKFVGDYSSLIAGLSSTLAPGTLKKVGIAAGAGLGAGFVASKVVDEFIKAVDVTKDFDKEQSSLGATLGANEKQMARLRKQAIEYGAATIFSASESAKAQTELAKGGLSVQQILGGGLRSALALAAAGELDLAQAATVTVNSMKLFELGGNRSRIVADGLATAANKTTGDVEDFAMALTQGGSVAKLAGYDFNNTLIILEALAEAGIKNSDAGTSMKAAMLQLLNPTKKQAELAEQLGISWLTQNGELKNGIELSRELTQATKGMTQAERAKTFGILAGQDGIRTLNALYLAGEDTLRRYSRANLEQGTASETAQRKTDNLAGDVEELEGAYETLQIQLGTFVTPALREATQAGTEAIRWVSDLGDKLNDTPIGDEGTWTEILGDSLSIAKEMATFTFDPAGSVQDMFDVIRGDQGEKNRLAQLSAARIDAARSLNRAATISADARRRAGAATRNEQAAEQNLRRARERFGDGSSEVLAAEIRLHRAKRRTIRLTNEAKRAEQLEGIERQVVASRTRDQVVSEKARISALNRSIRTLGRKRQVEIANNGFTKQSKELEDQILKKIKQRDNSQRRLNNVLGDAARQVGPKFAESLKKINGRAATMESVLGRIPSKAQKMQGALGQLPPVMGRVGTSSKVQFGKAEDSVDDFAEALNDKRRNINRNMRSMPEVQVTATDRMIEDFAAKVGAIKNDGKPQEKRQGGLIELVRQHFAAGGVPVALSPGEMYKTPSGQTGVVPGRPVAKDSVKTNMPVGTKVFTFDGQARLLNGESENQALARQRPHFGPGSPKGYREGGLIEPEIIGGSPKSRELANLAIGNLHDQAKKHLEKAQEQAAAQAGSLPGYTGPPADFKQLGDAAWVDAHTLAVGAYMANRFGVSITDGWRPQNAGYGAPNSSHKRGTPGNPGALDFAPPSLAFQQFAGKHIAGLTENLMNDAYSTGPHNHLAFFGKGGIVDQIQQLRIGGGVNINRTFRGAMYPDSAWFGLPELSFTVAAALAEAAGDWAGTNMPGVTMAQMTKGEGGGKPGSMGDDNGDGSPDGYGWLAITRPYGDSYGVTRFGGYEKMLNPVLNAAVAAKMYGAQGLGAWYGDDYVTDTDAHYEGSYDIRKSLGGKTFAQAVGSPGKGGGGMSAEEKAKKQRKARREAREERIKSLIQKSISTDSPLAKKGVLWQVLDMYAKYGDFDFVPGSTGAHGGFSPGRNEKAHLLTRAGQISAIANPNRGAGQLYSLVKWLGDQVEMTGAEDADELLSKKLKKARDKGSNVAERRREKRYKKMARFGENFPWGKALNSNEQRLAILRETIENAVRDNTAEWSPGGSEYTDAEVAKEVDLNRELLGRLDKKHGWLLESIPYVENVIDDYKRKIEKARKNPAEKWKIPGYKRGLDAARKTLGSGVGGTGLKSALVDLVGLTGMGGEWSDVTYRLRELGYTNTIEKQGASGISIGDLSQIIEAANYGVYRRIPKFHQGGDVTGSGHDEVLALVERNEKIYTAKNNDRIANALAAGLGAPQVIIHGDIVTDREDPVKVVIGDRRFKAEVRREISSSDRQRDQLARRGVRQ